LKKNKAFTKWLHLGNTEDKIEYRLSAITKREIRRRNGLSWENFITQMELIQSKTKHKILKHLNQEMSETETFTAR
jgi:hypothetical protein